MTTYIDVHDYYNTYGSYMKDHTLNSDILEFDSTYILAKYTFRNKYLQTGDIKYNIDNTYTPQERATYIVKAGPCRLIDIDGMKYMDFHYTITDEETDTYIFNYHKQVTIPSSWRPGFSYTYIWTHKDIEGNAYTGYTPFVIKYNKPNVIYYTHTALASGTIPDTIQEDLSIEVSYKKNVATVYLFIEFGVSIDGGETISWNTDDEILTNGYLATVPSDIKNYISVEVSKGTVEIGDIVNNNYIPLTITIGTNTPDNVSKVITNIEIKDSVNISSTENNPSSYNEDSAEANTEVLYSEATNSRKIYIQSIKCNYENHEF